MTAWLQEERLSFDLSTLCVSLRQSLVHCIAGNIIVQVMLACTQRSWWDTYSPNCKETNKKITNFHRRASCQHCAGCRRAGELTKTAQAKRCHRYCLHSDSRYRNPKTGDSVHCYCCNGTGKYPHTHINKFIKSLKPNKPIGIVHHHIFNLGIWKTIWRIQFANPFCIFKIVKTYYLLIFMKKRSWPFFNLTKLKIHHEIL